MTRSKPMADPRLRTSIQGQRRGFRSNRTTGGRSFAILDSGDFDGQFGYWVQDEDTLEERFIAEEDEEDVFWQVDENEAFIARRFKRRPQLRRAGKGRRKGKGRFKSHRKGSAHTAEGDDYNSSLYGKGKGKGKSKWKGGNADADFVKGKGKGKNKGKGKGKPFAKGGKSFEAEGTTSQPSQAAVATAPSTEDWSWYTEEDWSSWEEGAYLARHHKNKRKKKPRRGKKEKRLCVPGRGTDGQVHSKLKEEQEVPKYMASTSTKDDANKKKISEISDYGAAHVVFTDHDTALAVQFATVNLNKNPSYVILDCGCTRAMGSRYAIERLQKYVEVPERVLGPPPLMLPGAALGSLAARFCWQGQRFRLWTVPERVSGPPPSMLPGAALGSLAARFCWQGQHFRLWTVPERVSGPPLLMLPGAALGSLAARF